MARHRSDDDAIWPREPPTNPTWFARGILRALFALAATVVILWVSWRTSSVDSWLQRIAWWIGAALVLRAAQLGVRRLAHHQGWDTTTPAISESVMLAIGVALGALLTTGLLGSAAGPRMELEPYAKPPVSIDSLPALPPYDTLAAPAIEFTPTSAESTAAISPSTLAPDPAPTAATPVLTAPAITTQADASLNTPMIIALPPTSTPSTGLTVTSVDRGRATASGNDSLIFIPERDFLGTAEIAYQRCDAAGGCASGVVRLTVT